MSQPVVKGNEVELLSHFVRHRNAMAVYGDFGGIYEDYYLHLMQVNVRPTSAQDELFKETLATLTLHLMARPQQEMSAWTINLREPPLNLFVTGDSLRGNVIGRIFTEGVKTGERSLFIAQISHPRVPTRTSTVEIEGRNALNIVEQYYAQSEQLPARLFPQGGDAYAMVVAQPDIDMPWFEALDAEKVARLADTEELGFLERRSYHFACGCSLETVLRILVNTYGRDPDKVFAGEPELEARCPRCSGVFRVDPPALEAFLARGEASDP